MVGAFDGIIEVNLPDWTAFKAELYTKIGDIRQAASGATAVPADPKNFIFRGQGCKGWSLETSFVRMFKDRLRAGGFDLDAEYESRLRAFFDANRYYGIEEQYPNQNDERFLRFLEEKGQHHGLPTTLLDWSISPYIAAFFAMSDERNCKTGFVSVWALDTLEASRCYKPSEVEIIRAPVSNNPRMRMQQGLFTQNTSNLVALEEVFKFANKRHRAGAAPRHSVLFKFNLPVTEATAAVDDLARMGINYIRLFPGLEGLCKQFEFEMWRMSK